MRKNDAEIIGQSQEVEGDQFTPFDQISNVCLFFEANNLEDYQRILSFIPVVKGEVLKTESVVFYYGKSAKPVPEDSLRLIGKKDFNLFKQKNADLKRWLKAHEFDMLISFTEGRGNKPEHVIRDVKAKIKVGPNFSGRGQYFNISIGKQGEKLEFATFYKQVKHYFSQLNIRINQ